MSMKRPVVDAHGDTLLRLHESGLRLRDPKGHIHLEALRASPVGLLFSALYTPVEVGDRRLRMMLHMIEILKRELRDHADLLRQVRTSADVDGEGVGILLAIEGLDAMGTDLWLMDVFHEWGVRSALLTWNERNALADGASDQGSGGGLSEAGRSVVRRMEELGWVVDASHLAETSFWGLMETATGPVVASHSNARALWDHPRNLTDEQIRAVAQTGGVVGLNFCPMFVGPGRVSVDDLFRHLDHLLAVGGEDAVGFGSDFDGIEATPEGASDVTAYSDLWERLVAGYGERVAEKVAGDNFRRILRIVLPGA